MLVDSVDRLDSADTRSTLFPLFIGLFIFTPHNFSWAACFSSSCLFVYHNHVLCSWLLDNSQTCEITWSLCKNDWTDRVAIWRVDWPRPVSFSVRWVSHPKSAVRDVSYWRSFLVIKYFAALCLANVSSRRMVKIEHYLEVVYGHGLDKNVGTEVIQSHVNAEWVSVSVATIINVGYYKHYCFVNFC